MGDDLGLRSCKAVLAVLVSDVTPSACADPCPLCSAVIQRRKTKQSSTAQEVFGHKVGSFAGTEAMPLWTQEHARACH